MCPDILNNNAACKIAVPNITVITQRCKSTFISAMSRFVAHSSDLANSIFVTALVNTLAVFSGNPLSTNSV